MRVLDNHLPTAELQAINAAHHVHPFSNNADLAQKGARIITQAEGVMLTDSDGNEILDAMAGLWCVNIGYGRNELAEVAYRQMQQLPYYNTFFSTSHVPAIALAQKIAELTPGDLNRVFFSTGGSDANDTNIRLVRHYWAALGKPEKKVIVSRKNAYHGSTMGGASLGGMTPMHAQGGLPIPDIVHINQPHWYEEGGDQSPEDFGLARARELEETIARLGADKIAAFIGEPVQGAGGVIIPPATYWPEIQRICEAHDILLIADEVICGFGRTGNWFGSQTFGIRPDIMTIAKGLSSGYAPIGGSIMNEKVASVINADDFNHGYTYQSHPVAAAVAVENLRILDEEKIVDQVREVTGPHLAKRWAAFSDHPLVGEARCCGMFGALQLSPDKAARAGFADTGAVSSLMRDLCIEKGLMMRQVRDQMIISPPLSITNAELDLLADRAMDALEETYAIAKKEGMLVAA